ncbi:MAG: hypothetical protein DHS20C18_24150 [Saprospiraceae bacterium]|nr:MAG: hypothetical protein DHS20C18_24150 [Saprospiraceae bacterium]
MENKLVLFLMLLLPWVGKAFPTPPDLHQFHLSKCLVEYDEAEQALQISLHLFIDDFEEALRRQGKDKLFICTKKEVPVASEYIKNYLANHFRLSVDGKTLAFDFLGKESSEDLAGMWCYLEIPGVAPFTKLGIQNDIFLEVFDDQKNLVNIIGPGKAKGAILLQRGASSETIEF